MDQPTTTAAVRLKFSPYEKVVSDGAIAELPLDQSDSGVANALREAFRPNQTHIGRAIG
jgi:hypothetical protein